MSSHTPPRVVGLHEHEDDVEGLAEFGHLHRWSADTGVTSGPSGSRTSMPRSRIASTWAGHCSMKVTSPPARTRSAPMPAPGRGPEDRRCGEWTWAASLPGSTRRLYRVFSHTQHPFRIARPPRPREGLRRGLGPHLAALDPLGDRQQRVVHRRRHADLTAAARHLAVESPASLRVPSSSPGEPWSWRPGARIPRRACRGACRRPCRGGRRRRREPEIGRIGSPARRPPRAPRDGPHHESRIPGTASASSMGSPRLAVDTSTVALLTSFIHFVAWMSSTTATVPACRRRLATSSSRPAAADPGRAPTRTRTGRGRSAGARRPVVHRRRDLDDRPHRAVGAHAAATCSVDIPFCTAATRPFSATIGRMSSAAQRVCTP